MDVSTFSLPCGPDLGDWSIPGARLLKPTDFLCTWSNLLATVRCDHDPDDCGASSNTPFGPCVSFQQRADTLCVSRRGTVDRNGLRCHPNCGNPCGHGRRPCCGPYRLHGFLLGVHSPAAWPQH